VLVREARCHGRRGGEATGAAPTYLYRIAATLQREGTARREGGGFAAPGVEGPAAPEQPGEGAPPPTGVAIFGPITGGLGRPAPWRLSFTFGRSANADRGHQGAVALTGRAIERMFSLSAGVTAEE
jgi:hypothetical protein